MARTTGNTAPSGFAAGQLRDGQSIGIFDWHNSSKFEIRVRYYQNKLISEIRWQNGGNWGNWACQAQGYFESLKPGYTAGPYTELNDSIPLFATESAITALGIPMPGGLVPTAPTNALIPFKADADGRVTVFTEAVDQNKVLEQVANVQQQLATSFTSGGSNTGTGTGTGTGTNNTVRNVLIITAVVSVVVVVGIVVVKLVKGK